MSVLRIYSEKKRGFNVEAKALESDLRGTLGLDIDSVRIFHRYDVQGLSPKQFSNAVTTIFSEPNVDKTYNELPDLEGFVFAAEYLPGQFDQRADSAAQCIALETGGERPLVRTARIYAMGGELTAGELEQVKNYLINPVESREAGFELPESLDILSPEPETVPRITDFITWSDEEITLYHAKNGFAMTAADLVFCREYFKSENRDPSETELKVIDTYWSDHCRHTTFFTRLARVDFEAGKLTAAFEKAWLQYLALREEVYGERQKDVTLMDIATIAAKVLKKRGLCKDLDESEEINACSINAKVTVDGQEQDWLIQFKNETHNHPTEIEPFGGAATCLGGAIRDPLSGRSYVYQAMRVTGSGDPTVPFEDTLEGKLPQRKITIGAAQGYSSYGNQIGLATGQVKELYHEGYLAKRMEIGAVIAASPKENVIRGIPQAGDIILMLGGRTGRDGCGGATGSSKAHDSASIETCGAEVQKGNPPTERALQRLFRNPDASKLIQRCNDFGAGGVCVAIGELAAGLQIELDKVLKKYEGLGGTELAISESQERMAVVVRPEDADKFIELAGQENLECVPVARVDENPRLVMHWRGDTIVDISREFLDTSGVTGRAEVTLCAVPPKDDYRLQVPAELTNLSLADALVTNLSRLKVCTQKGLAERFDSSIGAGTVLMPFGGENQLSPEDVMCAKIPLEQGETDDATLMSYGYSADLSQWSPFHGAAYAVTESLAKLAAAGGDAAKARLTFQEYFPRLCDDPKRWGLPAAALLGALTAQMGFSTPAIGGKDSMSGSFEDMDVPPTLVSFAVGTVKASQASSATYTNKQAGSAVYFIPLPADKNTLLPNYPSCAKLFDTVSRAVKNGASASVVTEGGAAATVCQKCFGNSLGAKFTTTDPKLLFAAQYGAFVVVTDDISAFVDFTPIQIALLTDDDTFTIDGAAIDGETLRRAWFSKLEGVFPTTAKSAEMPIEIPLYTKKSLLSPAISIAKPRVLLPVFPGTNCEVDTARAFKKAGAVPRILVLRNLSPEQVEESARMFAKELEQSQILMLPGGFSAGDEPEGSGKFIAAFLRSPVAAEAIAKLLGQRDGLILGICNGFQALIKTGLLPYGEIRKTATDDPTLTFNNIGRHVSQMVYTRVTSVKSPWLSSCQAGDVHCVPVSHGEGRFAADTATLQRLAHNGQIATQYVSPDGVPKAEMPCNPNGSVCAIEGICSPDGRVFGKMAHSERYGENICKNVPGAKDMGLFASGVRYFGE
ncbi:MAG: phosphoribosylformylglycinamidine synthase [Oscillospiraceae bacterium]|nr:phosphoribosylformylglycinamidine synthase [Oscillospiraceae bacterium]